MPIPVLGIDIAKAKFDVALLQEGRTRHHVFPNRLEGFEQLGAWLSGQGIPQVHACLEATGAYGEDLAQFLHEAGHVVSIVNPARIKAFGQSQLIRTKTDKTDAALLARFCETQHPTNWQPPLPEMRELQTLVRRFENLQEIRQQEANRLDSGIKSAAVRESIQITLDFLDQELRRVEGLIEAHVEAHPGVQAQRDLLTSIPGVGKRTAAKLLGELPDLQNYESARELAAHAGLTPKQRESGSSVHGRPHISKTGSARLRKALYMPAIVAKRYNPVIRDFCGRLLARGQHPMSVIGAAMRKLLHLVFGILKSGRPFDPNYSKTGA